VSLASYIPTPAPAFSLGPARAKNRKHEALVRVAARNDDSYLGIHSTLITGSALVSRAPEVHAQNIHRRLWHARLRRRAMVVLSEHERLGGYATVHVRRGPHIATREAKAGGLSTRMGEC
jgi:hypothetical protein